MSPEQSEWINDIHQGDVRNRLTDLPENSVHCVMTSPPYFGLRDYGADEQIGLEESLDEYIDELVGVADDIRRVLRPDGSFWLNLGDSYGPNKQKQLVPQRVAIAIQDAGWTLRNDVTWVKPNPMPESVKDRLTTTTEKVFHFVPETNYWYDLDAIREPHSEAAVQRRRYDESTSHKSWRKSGTNPDQHAGTNEGQGLHPAGKNPGDVFEVATKSFPDAHFAVYPPELCEKPIKATVPPKVCVECGSPYDRVTSDGDIRANPHNRPQKSRALEIADEAELTDEHFEACRKVGVNDADYSNNAHDGGFDKVDEETASLAREAKEVLGSYFREFMSVPSEHDGWQQTCDCENNETEAGVVLDPFAGAGTTLLVAKRLGRQFVGIELNQDYVAMAQKRVGVTVDEPGRLLEDNETSLQAFTDGGSPVR